MSANKNGDASMHGQDHEQDHGQDNAGQGSRMGQVLPLDPATRHFDAFETDFFQQGEAGEIIPLGQDHFEDLEDASAHRRRLVSRAAMAVAAAALAAVGCAALWRGSARSSPAAAVTSAEMVPASPPAQSQAASPAPEPATVATAPTPAAEPSPEPAPIAQAQPAVQAQPIAQAAPVAQAEPAVQAQPVEEPAPKPIAQPALAVQAKPAVAPAVQAQPDDATTRCSEAIRGKRNKEILTVCPAAVTEDPSAATIAVALARIEFDRGHSAQAGAWSKKAIAANPEVADAYVFLGGAEQSAGHGKAAKQAYQQYLRLAPDGRYAADLRAIVKSL